ncbi:60S ribosomal protein L14 [Agrilus planipennis]|uniref:Large ribosomal subunit protein eL14 n=1 Tax=Agrilus planipennis TaxID=224129 RepID=A0A1W4XM44_AGRPL|nr:60S ribosomal protein L14 [Agrilus planipennis]
MPFSRFVETGRVALISDGPDKGKLAAIVDVIDQTRVLVDGPETKVSRQPIRLNQIHLTKLKIRFPYTGSTRVVRQAWKQGKINEKWSQTVWAQKLIAKKKRVQLTDFDRFKLRRAKSVRNKIRTEAYYRLKKVASRDGTLYGKKKMPKSGAKPKPKPKKEKAPKKK